MRLLYCTHNAPLLLYKKVSFRSMAPCVLLLAYTILRLPTLRNTGATGLLNILPTSMPLLPSCMSLRSTQDTRKIRTNPLKIHPASMNYPAHMNHQKACMSHQRSKPATMKCQNLYMRLQNIHLICINRPRSL